MNRTISTYYAGENGSLGHVKVHINLKEDMYYLTYHTVEGKQYGQEDLPGKTLSQAEMVAEDWALGKKLLLE